VIFPFALRNKPIFTDIRSNSFTNGIRTAGLRRVTGHLATMANCQHLTEIVNRDTIDQEINVSSMRDTSYPIHNAVRSRNFGLLPRLPSGSHCNRVVLGSPVQFQAGNVLSSKKVRFHQPQTGRKLTTTRCTCYPSANNGSKHTRRNMNQLTAQSMVPALTYPTSLAKRTAARSISSKVSCFVMVTAAPFEPLFKLKGDPPICKPVVQGMWVRGAVHAVLIFDCGEA